MTVSNVTLRVNKMPDNMRLFDFPCGEETCENTATMELELRTTDDTYKMPLCVKHANRLARDARISRV